MKHLKKINELMSTTGQDRKEPGEKYFVIWNNGKLFYKPKSEEFAEIHSGLARVMPFELDPKKKLIKFTPMDDWSDVKFILKVQQALKDFIKAGDIDENWKLQIGVTGNAEKSFGSNLVGEVLQYDAKWQKNIGYVFHGTTSWHLPMIKKNGILPRGTAGVDPNWDDFYTEESPDQIYLTIDFDRASFYAEKAVEALKKQGIKAKPVVLEIRDLPVDKLVPDDDFQNNMSMMQLLMAMQGGAPKKTFQRSIRNSGQFAMRDNVEPNQIYKVHKIKPEN